MCAQQQRGEDEVSRLVTGGWWPLVPGDQPASRVCIDPLWRVESGWLQSIVSSSPPARTGDTVIHAATVTTVTTVTRLLVTYTMGNIHTVGPNQALIVSGQ